MENLLLFIMTYVFVLVIYEIFIIGPAKKRKKSKKNVDKEMIEVKYLVTRYHFDLNKINYNQLIQICALISSFDIAIAVSVVLISKNFLMEMLLGFGTVFLLIIISYHIVYLFYKKKGMIKDEL